MRLTDEQQMWRTWLRERVAAVNPRARVTTDVEGWALVPGRLGQVEVTTDPAWLAVFTTRTRQVPKLLAVPGMRRHQMGDGEARMWFPADATDTLRAVFDIIRPRLRRQLSEDQKARLVAAGHRFSSHQHEAGDAESDLESVASQSAAVALPVTPPGRQEGPETAPENARAGWRPGPLPPGLARGRCLHRRVRAPRGGCEAPPRWRPPPPCSAP